jgi:hypothetical protein
MAGQQVFIKTLTRRKTRVNDPLASQPGAGGNISFGGYTAPTGTSGASNSVAGQSIAGLTNNIALVDLTDGPTRRIFSNKSTTVVVLPDVVTNFQVPNAVTNSGAAGSGTATGLVWRVPRNLTVWGVAAQFGSSPAGAGTTIVDVVSAVSPTAVGTSIFVDASRKPSATASMDYTTLGGANYVGNPGGQAIVNAAITAGTAPFGTANNGLGTAGNANVFLGSAVGLGICTPNNTFLAPAGTYLRVEIPGTAVTPGSNLSVQIFGY